MVVGSSSTAGEGLGTTGEGVVDTGGDVDGRRCCGPDRLDTTSDDGFLESRWSRYGTPGQVLGVYVARGSE